jgi:hypothetical protein
VRTVKRKSGATAVQVVWSPHRGSRQIEHPRVGTRQGRTAVLKAAAQQWVAARQLELGLEPGGQAGGPLPIRSSRMRHLLDELERGYRVLRLEDAVGEDEVFRDLVLAGIIKLDSLRIMEGAGSHRRRTRRSSGGCAYAKEEWRQLQTPVTWPRDKLKPSLCTARG